MTFQIHNHRIKLLAVIEAATVTGPAKNLLTFGQCARQHQFSNLPFVDTSIVTYIRNATSQPSNEFVSQADKLGIKTSVIDERYRFDLRVLDELQKIIRYQSPHLIQSHNVKSHLFMRLSGLWRSHKWIAFHHGYTTTDAKMCAYNHLDRWSLKAAHRVITMSQAFAQQLEKIGVKREKIRVLHNAIDVEGISKVSAKEIAALREGLNIMQDEQIILAVGRLSHEKGHLDLVRAFAQMLRLDSTLRAKLLLVGEGPERERLNQEVITSGLKNQVVLIGQVANVKAYYQIADLLVLPSHSEGSPNVLLEAMAARVPVVATTVGGIPEIATNNETALLVEAQAVETMAQAMMKLLSGSALANCLAEKAHRYVTMHHSPEARLRALLGIYKELLPDHIVAELQVA